MSRLASRPQLPILHSWHRCNLLPHCYTHRRNAPRQHSVGSPLQLKCVCLSNTLDCPWSLSPQPLYKLFRFSFGDNACLLNQTQGRNILGKHPCIDLCPRRVSSFLWKVCLHNLFFTRGWRAAKMLVQKTKWEKKTALYFVIIPSIPVR